VGFKDQGWLDEHGTPSSDQARVTERFRRPYYGTLEIDVTVTDLKAFTGPFTFTVHQRLMPDTELIEFVCGENNRSAAHLVGRLIRHAELLPSGLGHGDGLEQLAGEARGHAVERLPVDNDDRDPGAGLHGRIRLRRHTGLVRAGAPAARRGSRALAPDRGPRPHTRACIAAADHSAGHAAGRAWGPGASGWWKGGWPLVPGWPHRTGPLLATRSPSRLTRLPPDSIVSCCRYAGRRASSAA